MSSKVDLGLTQRTRCPKCGRHFVQTTEKEMELGGWKKHWSLKKFGFVWTCPICVSEERIHKTIDQEKNPVIDSKDPLSFFGKD